MDNLSIGPTGQRRRGWRQRLKTTVTAIAALAAIATAGLSTRPAQAADATKITYWFWGESDIPGIDTWMKGMVSKYQAVHADTQINVVPQSSDTLIGGFRLASQSHSGPDIDTQWATLPTLTPYWNKAAVAISDYVPATEIAQWVNASENEAGGKIVAMPIYLIGVPLVWNKDLFKKAGLDPDKAPVTWSDFLADCAALKAHGITPIGMGNSDGSFGAWMFAIYLKQELNSLDELKSAIGNTGGFSLDQFDGLLTKMYAMMADLVAKGYINSDVSSLSLTQGWQLFPQQKAAMAFTTDGNVLSWGKTLGEDKIGVAAPPIWGGGKLADTYDVTQSSDEFITSWAKNKQAAADFLVWLHQPDNMAALYTQTGAFPADKRFPTSSITDGLAKQLFALDTAKQSIWLENYIPPEVDSDADTPAGQLILSKSGTPEQAVAIWNRVIKKWRMQQIPEFIQFKKWAGGNS
ncbi:ABC transporter substrate-binding protein [Acidisoma silvae]|uniref:Extracellular solute-binding protein n=1 Tax=Acidisoma silvae TaxID=2802396 RepID=A0A964E041_9PROT|nr:extracellular solute-binding protein [Acidisoma silvae]MCB8876767.1 extracellular solute-binding protein [Acidisoma silvae]